MYKLISKIGIDRIAHFGVGVFITMLCILLFGWFGIYPTIINSILFTFIVAMIKESIDVKKDVWDIFATMLGSVAMLGMFFYIKFLL